MDESLQRSSNLRLSAKSGRASNGRSLLDPAGEPPGRQGAEDGTGEKNKENPAPAQDRGRRRRDLDGGDGDRESDPVLHRQGRAHILRIAEPGGQTGKLRRIGDDRSAPDQQEWNKRPGRKSEEKG